MTEADCQLCWRKNIKFELNMGKKYFRFEISFVFINQKMNVSWTVFTFTEVSKSLKP